jgi:8-oxo-dGTP pyrophosphatase MutT (NUDIX family)
MTNPPRQLQDSAVLVPVFKNGDGRETVLIVRRTDHGIHGGQLAFPGGKHETGDADMMATALRETREEVGIAEDAVDVLEELPVVETNSTGYRIYPFLGRIPAQTAWEFDPREVAEVIPVGVDYLARPDVYGENMKQFPHLPQPVRIRYYRVGEHKLWGASYRIITPLIHRLQAGEWDT